MTRRLPLDETELKFEVPTESRAALERALRRRSVRVERMQAIYFDTADEHLGRHGVAVRLRKEGRRWVQTAKALTTDSLRRLEHNVVVALPRGNARPALDLSLHDAEPVGDALRRALGAGSDGNSNAVLSERFRTDVSRIFRTVRVPGARVELALDVGKITTDERSIPISEFELELKSGDAAALVGVSTQWAARHGLWLSTLSKAERGARLARGELEGRPIKPAAPRTDAKQTVQAFLVASIENCLSQIFSNASEIGAGALDEEFVHRLRIGLRRLRTALRELKSDTEGIDPAWERSLRSTFHELGTHRDFVVVVPGLRTALDVAGAPLFPDPGPEAGARSPTHVVRDACFQHTLLGLLAFVHGPQATAIADTRASRNVCAFATERLEDLRRRLARDARRFAALQPACQHRVRKRLKRLRYLSEFAAPLFGAKRVAHYLASWREAQDALGEYNDQRIAIDAFRTQASQEPRAWFAVGWLVSQHGASVSSCESALRRAVKTRAFWNR